MAANGRLRRGASPNCSLLLLLLLLLLLPLLLYQCCCRVQLCQHEAVQGGIAREKSAAVGDFTHQLLLDLLVLPAAAVSTRLPVLLLLLLATSLLLLL